MNSALPIPVPRVSISTVPFWPTPAPNLISASPAASASLITVTSRPVAFANRSRASKSIQDLSTLAAVLVTPSVTTPGNVMPAGPVQVKPTASSRTDRGDRGRLRGLRGVDLDPVGEQLPGAQVDRRGLDPGSADVNAQYVRHDPSVVCPARPTRTA